MAEAVGISLPGVQNLERGDVMPSLEIGLSLAKCLRKPVQWILYGTESDPDRVPVIGTTESGPDRDWQPGEPANTERFLPFVSQRSTVYALTVGNQIQRNYQPGDVILVDSSLTLVPGEDVLVCDNNGEITIQRLARYDEQHSTLIVLTLNGLSMIKSDLQICAPSSRYDQIVHG